MTEWCWGGCVVAGSGRAGRLGREDRVLRLPALGWAIVLVGQIRVLVQPTGAGLAAVAVKALALIWKLAQMDIFTIRVS